MAFRTNKTPVLQEKSASGSIASFNTALAMPLSSCNIAVNAWQEGSGEPSPSNERPIHGFDKLHINMCNFNQLLSYKDVSFTAADVNFSRSNNYWSAVGLASSDITDSDKCFNTVPAVIGHKYILGILASDKIKSYDYYSSSFNNRKSGLYMINNVNPTIRLRVCLESGVQYNETFSGIVIDLTQLLGTKLADELYQMEQTEMGTGVALFKQIFYKDYYAYNAGGTWVSVASVNGDSYPDYAEVALGEDVYGGVYNSVTGGKDNTHVKVVFDGSNDENWNTRTESGVVYYYLENALNVNVYSSINVPKFMCNKYKEANRVQNTGALVNTADKSFCNQLNNYGRLWIIDREILTLDDFKTSLSNQPIEIICPLIESIKTQLIPTPINTSNGVNNIFCDTGDISLVFNDLDIAKRGNFREVFKLPS